MKLTDLITPEELKAAALEMEGYGGPMPTLSDEVAPWRQIKMANEKFMHKHYGPSGYVNPGDAKKKLQSGYCLRCGSRMPPITLAAVLDVVDEAYSRNVSEENWHSRVRNCLTAKFQDAD